MNTQVGKWGNSLAVRIPKPLRKGQAYGLCQDWCRSRGQARGLARRLRMAGSPNLRLSRKPLGGAAMIREYGARRVL